MKKSLLFIVIGSIIFFLSFNFIFADEKQKGNPFQGLWNAIAFLQEQINNIQLIPGPQGEQGPPGPLGSPSWDETRIVNLENRVKELEGVVFTPTPNPCLVVVCDNFSTYAIGNLLGQGSWIDYKNGHNYKVQGDSVFEGTRAVYVNALADSVIVKSGNALSDGRQSFYIKTQDRTSWGFYIDGNAQFRVTKGVWGGSELRNFVGVSFRGNGHVAYYDPVTDDYLNFATYNDNEWTLLEIEWRSSDTKARYRVNSGTWTDWKPIAGQGVFTNLDHVGFDFFLPSGSGGVYFDNLH